MSTLKKIMLSMLFMFAVPAAAVQVKAGWADTVKLCIIWNEGTGSDGMPDNWQQEVGEIGETTKNFVMESIKSVKAENVKVFTGSSQEWAKVSQSAENLKEPFGGELPDVIAYINAGYTWNQHKGSVKDTLKLYRLLREASNAGVGIVAIGDDAAYDAKSIFPLTGYKGKGSIIQYHSWDSESGGLDAPYMEDGIVWVEDGSAEGGYSPDHGFTTLQIALDADENKRLPDQGILSGVTDKVLQFKKWQKDGRGQADADVWGIDTVKNKLDNYAEIGFQSGTFTADGEKQSVPPAGYDDLYKVIAALQSKLNRVVMLCYQPQYLAQTEASQQIVYNSLFWASKAKEMMKLGTPNASPANVSPTAVSKITLTVDFPQDKSTYKIRHQINGGDWVDYGSPFTIPQDGSNVTVKACAIPTDPKGVYTPSDTAEFFYEYKGGPNLAKARLTPGKIDPASSKRLFDTLTVSFTSEVKSFTTSSPFLSKDSKDAEYKFTLEKISSSGTEYRFLVKSISGKPANYLPNNREDKIAIWKDAKIEDLSGTVQDGTNLQFVPLEVDEPALPKIAKPQADPEKGIVQNLNEITLSVEYPEEKYWTLRYTTDGSAVTSSSPEVPANMKISLPADAKEDVTLTVLAYSDSTHIWKNSDTLVVTYDFVTPPVLDSAVFSSGSMKDEATSEMEPDTLTVYFDQDVNEIGSALPFISTDRDGAEYRFRLKDLEDGKGRKHTYLVESMEGKDAGYLPEHLRDSIIIDVNANVTGSEFDIRQDGSNNRRVPLNVRKSEGKIKISSIWYDSEDEKNSGLKSILTGFKGERGSLILIDPLARLTESDWDRWSGSFMIFDALGHLVLAQSSLESEGSVESGIVTINGRTHYAILWNGNNEMGRRVGSGAYLGMVHVFDGNGHESLLKEMMQVPARQK